MTQPQSDPPPPTGPRPLPHLPLVERVAKLEQLIAQMATLHNAFAADVSRELGLE